MVLSGKQRRYLRSLGHHLKPVVRIGKAGLTEGVLEQIEASLEDHELIKVRFGRSYEGGRDEALRAIVDRSRCEQAGAVGGTVLLYRPRADDPDIRLP